MDSATKKRLEDLLRRIQLLISASGESTPAPGLNETYSPICKLVFDEQIYQRLWDEPILSQLDWLLQVKPPELSTFGG